MAWIWDELKGEWAWIEGAASALTGGPGPVDAPPMPPQPASKASPVRAAGAETAVLGPYDPTAEGEGDTGPSHHEEAPDQGDTGPLRIFQDETGAIKSSGSFTKPGARLPEGQAGPAGPTATQIMGRNDMNNRPGAGGGFSGGGGAGSDGGFVSSGDPVLDAMQKLASDYMTPKDLSSTLSTATRQPGGGYTFTDRLGANGQPMKIGDENNVSEEDFARGMVAAKAAGEYGDKRDYRKAQEGELAARTKLYEAQAGQTASGQGKGGYRGSKEFSDIQMATRTIENLRNGVVAALNNPLNLDPAKQSRLTMQSMILNRASVAAMQGDLEEAQRLIGEMGGEGTATEATPPPGAQPGGSGADFAARYRARGTH